MRHSDRKVAKEKDAINAFISFELDRIDLWSFPTADLVEVELNVEGMECSRCSSRVHDALLVSHPFAWKEAWIVCK